MEGRRGRRELWLCNFVGSKQIREARAMWAALWLWIYTTKRGKTGGRVMTNSKEGAGERGGRVLRHRQLNFDNIKPTFSFDMSANPKRTAPWRLCCQCFVQSPTLQRGQILKTAFHFLLFVRLSFVCVSFICLACCQTGRGNQQLRRGPESQSLSGGDLLGFIDSSCLDLIVYGLPSATALK